MRWRPRRAGNQRPAETSPRQVSHPVPPLPENPYRRLYTRTPTFEELVRRTKGNPPDQEK